MFQAYGSIFWSASMEKGIKYRQDQSSILLLFEHNFRHNAVVLGEMLQSIMLKFSSIIYLTLIFSRARGCHPFFSNDSLFYREKWLRHVAMVANFLDDDKPKTSLKKVNSQCLKICIMLAKFSGFDPKRTVSKCRKTENFLLCSLL